MMPLYNSKTHSKMDINDKRGRLFPPIPSTLLPPPYGSRGPFGHFDVRAEFVKPWRAVCFNPREKKNEI